jgi:membrane protein
MIGRSDVMAINFWRQGRQTVAQLGSGLQKQARHWAPLFRRALDATFSPETSLIASSIGYFTLISLFPLTILAVAIASLWIDPMLAENEIVTQLEFVAPALGELLGANLERIVRSRGPVTGVAALFLLWSASNIFHVLTRTMDQIWGADIGRRRAVWRHRGVGILMALSLTTLLLVVLFAEGTALTIWNSLLPEGLEQFRPLTNRFWAAFLSVVVFALLYYFLPHVTLEWRDVVPGALAGGLIWDLAKRIFLAFIGAYLSRSNLVYGSVGTITAFLTWAYVSSFILLFGGHLNVVYYRQRANNEPGERARKG